MTKFVSKFFKNESGATAIEYGLIAALLSVGIATALGDLKTQLVSTYTSIKNSMAAAG